MDTIRVLACGIIFAVSSSFSVSALALDVGQCGTVAAMTESLKAEGQHSFASATRLTYPREGITKERTLLGILITANDSGSQGYIVQTDKPFGDGPTQACIYSRMASIRLYDARKPGIVPAVLSKGSEAATKKRCDTLIKSGEEAAGTCGYLNALLQKSNDVGERAIVQADNMRKQKDGSYRADAVTITITANMVSAGDKLHEGSGVILNSTSDGAAVMLAGLHSIEYTSGGEQRLGGQAKVK